ncbi:hypothetical protein GYMLUDRAFT_253368 [Collybiopsis luxurians FD-317 M1]|uniref:CxC1-like cysteine cluster associated with KDZ transposases domain-containing protein n=1 Tax=Collybiopsis luxurians FD-317 M1 TaxID=944289 RepID=A0A0D0C5M8_9AGAR|nr:hypothetical protein GYMLUDRAFT_253368 [Collybiopsis luxurians FD-317 M1]
MSIRPRLPKNKVNRPAPPTVASYAPQPLDDSTRRNKNARPLLVLLNRATFTQNPKLPHIPGQVGVRGNRLVYEEDVAQAGASDSHLHSGPAIPDPVIRTPPFPYCTLPPTFTTNEVASTRIEATTSGYTMLLLYWPSFNNLGFEKVDLWASACKPAALQLVRSGLFPCSPVYPTLAVDIRVLDFVRQLFLCIAPNHTAWCATVTDFLGSQGYRLPGEDPLRRRFSNALQWFVSLHDAAMTQVNALLDDVRRQLIPTSCGKPIAKTPATHCDNKLPRVSGAEEVEQAAGPSCHVRFQDEIGNSNRKRDRCSESADEDEVSHPSQEQEQLPRPSEYLRSQCPLCFGGSNVEGVMVCLDACFMQKHNAQKGGRDLRRTHPNTFLSEDEIAAWKAHVDSVRPPKDSDLRPSKQKKTTGSGIDSEDNDHVEAGLRVPKSALDGCLASFTAADEARVKGSTQFFDVTAQMAILCRHDRPLWVVNMTTPGEAQHYTLALLAKLFEHLPQDVLV